MITPDHLHTALDAITADARVYRFTFGTPTGQQVMSHLSAFCGVYATALPKEGPVDPYTIVRMEGRREVWLMIQRYIQLTPEQLFKVFNKVTIQELLPTNEE